jgi:uncharacterized protein YkwD
MKGFITILLVLLTSVSVGQNSSLMRYINEYRVVNGKTSVTITDELSEISLSQAKKIVSDDSLSHSGGDKNFDIEYGNPESSYFDVEKFATLYVVFLFSKSPKHNAIMLSGDVTTGGTAMYISDNVEYKSNKRVIGGKTYEFSKIVSHVEVNFVGVLNLK